MSKIKDAILTMPETGPCDIDVDAIIQLFDTDVGIFQWKDTYKLVEVLGVKVAIKKEDANRIIHECGLTPVSSQVFTSGTTWILHPLL